jgi:hypothetical protein
MPSTSAALGFGQGAFKRVHSPGAAVLTKPGNTQVYSPFGTYVVEQHGGGFEKPQRSAVPEPPVVEQSVALLSPEQKDLPKAA